MLKCRDGNGSASFSQPCVSMDCRVNPRIKSGDGNDDTKNRSRDAFFCSRPSYEQAKSKNLAVSPTFVR
jgi:hypothetical protein